MFGLPCGTISFGMVGMKKILLLAALVSFAVLPLRAQVLGLEVGGYGSWWRPADLDKGYGGGAVVRGQFLEFLGVDVRAGYFSFSDPDVDMVPVEAGLMLRVPIPVVSLFAGVGGGYYQFSGEKGFSLDNETGYFGNAGAEVTLGDWRFFLEWRYNVLEPEISKSGAGLVEGKKLDFSGNSFNLGATYKF